MNHPTSSTIMLITATFLLVGAISFYTALGRLQATLLADVRIGPPALDILTGAPDEDGRWVISPRQGSVCPGESITWDVSITVQRDAFVQLGRWVKQAESNLTVMAVPPLQFGLEKGTTLAATRQQSTVGLPPGEYYVLNGAVGNAVSRPAMYRVPFVIRDDCERTP